MVERIFERYAWILLAAVGVLLVPIAVGDLLLGAQGDPVTTESVTGLSWEELQATDPAAARLVDLHARTVGAWLLGLSLLGLAIALTGYRRRERWSWYALWSWPLALGLVIGLHVLAILPGSTLPPPLFSAPILLGLAVLGLLFPIRLFFARDGSPA